jgi:hypothetical protein
MVDGIAYYGHLRKWRFDSLPVLARVHLLVSVAATVMTVVFVWWSEAVWVGVPANMPLQPASGAPVPR